MAGVVCKVQKTVTVTKAFTGDCFCNGTEIQPIATPVVLCCRLVYNPHVNLKAKVPPALEGEELLFFNQEHQRLHTLFHQAREASFSNAYGKSFVKSVCEILVLPTHNTNPRGRFQPGSMTLEWVVGEDVQPAGERPNNNPRRGLGDEEIVADVVILSGELVTTVFEVKTEKGGVSQNKEQMAGLFRDGQRTILGIEVEPHGFHINLFVADHQHATTSLETYLWKKNVEA